MKKKLAAIILACACASALLAGCGSSQTDGSADASAAAAGEDGTETDDQNSAAPGDDDLNYSGEIKVWAADAVVDFTNEQINTFKAQHPGLSDTTFTVESVGEGDAASNMITDVEAGADIYTFAQDQFARLVSAGALEEVAPEYVDAVKTENDEGSVAAATVGDTLYAYPLTSDNGYFLYYDSSVVSDPSDLDTILSDCESAGKNFYMELNSGWYQTAFFFGTGCDLSYETDNQGNFTAANVDYASDQGLVALKEIIKVASSKAFQNGSSASDATDIGAIVDGTWDAATLQELFGDHYACAKLPSFTGSDGKTYQMSGYSGYKLLGEKPQEDEAKLAVCDALAYYLAGGDVQLARYKAVGWGPSNLAAQQSAEVKNDKALTALNEQLAYDKPQGQYPGDYWTLATSLGDDVITGSLTTDSSDEDLMAALQSFQDTCISYAAQQ